MAAAATSIHVEGLRELQRAVAKADKELGKELRAVNKRAAEIAKEGVQPLAPIGATGALARSVGVEANQRSAAVKAGSPSRVPYAGVINFGWPARNIEATNFLGRGVGAKVDDVRAVYEVDLRTFLDAIDTGRT